MCDFKSKITIKNKLFKKKIKKIDRIQQKNLNFFKKIKFKTILQVIIGKFIIIFLNN